MLNRKRKPLKKQPPRSKLSKGIIYGPDIGIDVVRFPVPSNPIINAKYYLLVLLKEDESGFKSRTFKSKEELEKEIQPIIELELVPQVISLLYIIQRTVVQFAKERGAENILLDGQEFVAEFLDMAIINTISVISQFLPGKQYPNRVVEMKRENYNELASDVRTKLEIP